MGFASKGFVKGQDGALEEKIMSFITSGTVYKGTWNAETNTPTITQGVGTNGWFYYVSTPGKWDNTNFLINDKIIFKDSSKKWERIPTGVETDNPIVVAYIDQDSTLPTTRQSGSSLVIGDYVKIKSTATLPFDIEGIHIDNYGDAIEWNGNAWQLKDYYAGKTDEIAVKDKTTESLSGNSTFQNTINIENVTQLKKVIQSITLDATNKKLQFTKYDNTKYELDISDTAENNTNLVMSKAVWNEIIKSTDCVFELDTTDTTKDKIHIKLVNNAGTTIYEARIDLADLLVLQNKTQELKNKTIDADDNTIKDITGTNFKDQTSADKKKTWVWNGTAWVLGKAGSEVDDITIEENTDEKLQVKDEGITTAKVKDKNITNAKLEDGSASTGITTDKINTSTLIKTIADTSADTEIPTGKAVYDFCKAMGWQVDFEVVDSEKFQYKFYLKDKAGVKVTGSESTVFDLPLELLKVSNLEYDNTNEKFILTYVDATGTEKTVELPASGILKGVVTETATQTITNKTIDVDDNTVSNIEVDNLKASAVSTSIPSSGAVDTKLATEKAVNDFGKVDNSTIERDTTNGMQIKDNGVSSAKIVDGAVTKAKIDTDAKVVYEEDTQTIINKSIDLDNNTITNIETDNFKSGVIETTDISNDVTKIPCSDIVKIKLGDKLNLSGGTMTGAIAMGSNKITGLATPTDDNDAVNKSYVSTNCQSKISAGTGDPSGGSDGDVYIKYTA